MSEFKTTIPLPTNELIKLLPAGSAIHPLNGVRLTDDKQGVEVNWYNDGIKTNASRAVDYSMAALRGEAELPPEILPECRKVQNPEVAQPKARRAKQGQ